MKDLIDIVIIQETMGDNLEKNINKIYNTISLYHPENTTIVTLHELCYLKYIPITRDKKRNHSQLVSIQILLKSFVIYQKLKKYIFCSHFLNL